MLQSLAKLSFALCAVCALAWAPAWAQERPDLVRWQPYLDGQEPKAAALPDLLQELTALLGNRDPKLRDDLAYMQLARWILPPRQPAAAAGAQLTAKPVASDAQCLDLLRAWQSNLTHRLAMAKTGEDDPALLRSFSALSLALLVARDNRRPFLDPDAVQQLLTSAANYLAQEPDERGFVAGLGWVHASAHAADLLWHLARNQHLKTPQQGQLLDAIRNRVHNCKLAFAAGEDDRLARAAFALTQRADFDIKRFEAWLRSWQKPPKLERPAQRITFGHNRRILMQALYARLSLASNRSPNADRALNLTARLLTGKL